MSDSEYSYLLNLLVEQRDNVRDWITATASETTIDQRHLIDLSPERAYWHHGYQAALDDVIQRFTASDPARCSADKPN